MKILLTSTGFTNPNIKNKFINLLNKDVKEAKVLFIITAAQDPDAVRILPACLDDLTECGIIDENIKIYDMHKLLTQEEMNKYDAIYVCGGNTEYLVDRMNEINIKQQIQEYLKKGGIYVGVSAGTIAAQALNLIKNEIDVHCENESENKEVTTEPIYLTDDQALLIKDNEKYIFE